MNPTHIHLLITHLPIYGAFAATVVLIYGLYTKSHSTVKAAYLVFVIAAIGGGIAYFTGEAAEETAEHIAGVSEDLIHEHEEAGEFAIIVNTVMGIVALAGFVVTNRRPSIARKFSIVALIIALFSFAVTARTGYLGGQIRHTEISEQPGEGK